MGQLKEITSGLHFPEGPIAMPDGSAIVGGFCFTDHGHADAETRAAHQTGIYLNT
jgi:hypothetical protein